MKSFRIGKRALLFGAPFLGLTLIVALALNASSPKPPSSPVKKLIEYGWDVPTPDLLPANIQAMEQRPFDGVVVKLSVGPMVFTHAPYPAADFTQDREHLKATHFTRFTDNFLIVWASSEQGWNWLSDSDWAAAEQNTRNFARTAAEGGFKGILFDTETYGPNTWAYNTNLYPGTTFAQLQSVVRQRGARFMTLLQSELPAAKVLSTWFLGTLQYEYDLTGGNLEQSNLPLLRAFIEGIFGAANSDVRLIDGNESSYHYTDANAFNQSRKIIFDAINHLAPDYQAAARAHLQIGQAIYADEILNLLNSPRSFGFYISSQKDRLLLLEHNVYYALRTSDQYVWFYSENIDWWKGPNIPSGVEDAIIRARQSQASDPPPIYDMRPIDAAKLAMSQAVTLQGQILTKDGKPISHVTVQSGFTRKDGVESACYVYQVNLLSFQFKNGQTRSKP